MSCTKIGFVKVQTYYRGACAGSVMVPEDASYLNMVTGWKVPITKSKKFPNVHEAYIELRHNKLHPSRW